MTTIEIIYGFSGSFTCLAGIVMMLVYSVSFPWWRSHTGRMLMTYAVAETGMSAIFAVAVVFKTDPVWFRYSWVILQVVVGCALWYQTSLILVLRRKRKRGEISEVRETD